MKAQLVSENISFKRGGNPLGTMDLGGFSFDTLSPGALLRSKKYFGVSKSTGTLSGYHSAISIGKGDWLLVTDVRDQDDGNKKNISWRRYHHSSKEKALSDREIFKNEGYKQLRWYGITSGFFGSITKRKFDYRLEIIESGFNISESLNFKRGQDPKRAMGIGEKTWNNLKPGDFLRPKKELRTARGQFKPPSYKSGKKFYPEDYVVIITYKHGVVEYNRHITMGYKMHLHRCWDLDEAMKIRSSLEMGELAMPREHDAFNRPIEGSYQQWENRFEIYEG